jgi:hypothetical protein
MKDYLCKCNNCDLVLVDENPQADAKKNSILKNSEKQLIDEKGREVAYMEKIQDDDGTYFWACPVCLTDDCLTDNIS